MALPRNCVRQLACTYWLRGIRNVCIKTKKNPWIEISERATYASYNCVSQLYFVYLNITANGRSHLYAGKNNINTVKQYNET